jgi:hypothetical protein
MFQAASGNTTLHTVVVHLMVIEIQQIDSAELRVVIH